MQIILLSLIAFFLFLKILSIILKNIFLNYISTPLITVSIIMLCLYGLYYKAGFHNFLITGGAVLSLAGDIFNLNEKKLVVDFKCGVLFFIMTQLFYFTAFTASYIFSFYQIPAVLLYFTAFIFIVKLFPLKISSNFLKIEIMIYGFIISLTLLLSFFNLLDFYSLKNLYIFAGMFLFTLSDILLCTNLLYRKFSYYSIFVWLLYAPAQTLIALSIMLSK